MSQPSQSIKQYSLPALFLLMSLMYMSSSWAIQKCVRDGEVTYTDQMCHQDATSTPFTQPIAPAHDIKAAQKRHRDNLQQLKKIEQEKQQALAQQKKQAHLLARQTKQANQQQFRCEALRSKQTAAKKHYQDKRLKGQATPQAQARLNQANLAYQHHCVSL